MSDICISAPLLLKSFSKLTIEFSCSDIMPFAHHVHSSGYLMMRAANRQTEAKVDPRRYIVKVNIIRLRMSFVCPVPLSMPNWRPPFSPVWATLPKNSSVSDCLFGPLSFQYWGTSPQIYTVINLRMKLLNFPFLLFFHMNLTCN